MSVTVTEFDVEIDGRTLHAYDTSPGSGDLAVVWHHGTPNIGRPPTPLFEESERLGIRWIGYDRPGYGGSTPLPGRTIGSAARDVEAVVGALGLDSFAVLGHSGGATHALGTAAGLSGRVTAVVAISGLAPYDAAGLDWFAGMAAAGAEGLRAAASGRAAKEAFEAEEHEPGFADADWKALEGVWGWFGSVVGPAVARGPAPLIDDDIAYVSPWGCTVAEVTAPAYLLHGSRDRVVPVGHARWLASRLPAATLHESEGDGHISVLESASAALGWLRTAVDRRRTH